MLKIISLFKNSLQRLSLNKSKLFAQEIKQRNILFVDKIFELVARESESSHDCFCVCVCVSKNLHQFNTVAKLYNSNHSKNQYLKKVQFMMYNP